LLKLTRFHSFQVELFSHADTIIVMDEGRFKYCGPFHPPTIRKLFPNASVPDVPADGAPSDVDVQAGDNMLAVGPVSGNPNAISVYGMAFGNDGGWSLPAPTTTLTKTTSHHDLQLQIAQLEVVVDSHKGPRLKAPVEVSKAPKGGYSELIARWRWYSVVPWFFFMCFAAQSARTWSDIWISQWTQNKNAWGAPFGMGPLQKWEYFGIYVAFIGMFFFLQVQFLCTIDDVLHDNFYQVSFPHIFALIFWICLILLRTRWHCQLTCEICCGKNYRLRSIPGFSSIPSTSSSAM